MIILAPQKHTPRTVRRWISSFVAGLLLALPCWVNAGGPVDLNLFNVQSCVSDDAREATAQKYLKAVDVPQYPRQFLENLKYALKHDWLLQEDFYTVDNIRQLLGASEVQVKCLENNQFLPSFTTYEIKASTNKSTAETHATPPSSSDISEVFYDKAVSLGRGSLRYLDDGRLGGRIIFSFAEPMDIDFIEMTFGRFLSTPEFLASPLAKELGIFARDRHGTRYIDLSDDQAWRYVAVSYIDHDSRRQQIFIESRQRKQP